MTHKITFFVAALAVVMGCNSSSGDEELDRCESAARKIAKIYGGDENRQADIYKGALDACTVKPGEELTQAGSDYLDCVADAAHGAAVLRCEYEFEKQAKEEALENAASAAKDVWSNVCGGINVDLDNDPRMKEVSEYEAKARAFGATDDEVNEMLKKAAKSAGCPDSTVDGIGE